MTKEPASPDRLEKNKRIAVDLLNAIADGDQARIDALLHPDATWWVVGFGEMTRAELMAALQQTLARATRHDHRVLNLTAEDNRVSVESEGEFHFPERIYRNNYHDLVFIEGEQVVRVREYLDPRASLGEI